MTKRTDLVATLDAPMIAGRNVIWTAAFDLAWKELAAVHGGPIELSPPSPLAMKFTKSPVAKADVPDDGLVAVGGAGTAETVERIRKQLKQAFGGDFDSRLVDGLADLPEQSAIGYAAISRHLPFKTAFDELSGEFHFAQFEDSRKQAKANVRMFGVYEMVTPALSPQVRILWHRLVRQDSAGDDEEIAHGYTQQFIVELVTTSKSDRLILASVGPGRTLGETVATVMEHVAKPNTYRPKTKAERQALADWETEPRGGISAKMSSSVEMLPFEGLRVPVVDMDLLADYLGDLRGKVSSPGLMQGYGLVAARQAVRFRLDQKGATLDAEGTSSGLFGAPIARQFRFDEPFLILLLKKDAKRPYFAVWIGNDELLVPAKPDGQDEGDSRRNLFAD